jgi:hypothetical protein
MGSKVLGFDSEFKNVVKGGSEGVSIIQLANDQNQVWIFDALALTGNKEYF